MFSPHEFVEIGDALREGKADGPGERRFRTAISRAYLAVYLTLRQEIRDARSDSAYDVEHGALAKWLADHVDPIVGRFGNEFRALWKKRTVSDYQLHTALSEPDERISLLSARDLIRRTADVVKRVPPATFPVRPR